MEAPGLSKPKRTKRTPEQKEARKAARLAAATRRESSEQSEDTCELAALLPDVSGPDDPDDGLLGLSSLRNKVTESVYIDLLTLAAAAQAKLVAAQTEAQKQVHQAMKMKEKVKLLGEKAEKARAEGKLEAAMTQVKLAKQKARADKLQVNLTKSNTQRLALIGHVDLRAILDDVLPKSKKDEPLKLWLQSEQTFVTRCRAEAKIVAANKGKKVTIDDIAKRLSALWARACSKVHPAVTSRSWAEVNVDRVLPLEVWLEDKTDLLLMYLLLDEKNYPVKPPTLISPTYFASDPDCSRLA